MLVLLKAILSAADTAASLNKPDFLKAGLFPMIHNMPSALMRNNSLYPIISTSCVKWFMYDYNASLTNSSFAMLMDRIKNDPMREYCDEVNMPVPYFEKHDAKDFNQYIVGQVKEFGKKKLKIGKEIEGIEKVPDGTVVFKEMSPNRMDLKLQINDMLIFEYHNNNGVTKSGYRLPASVIEENNKLNPLRKNLKNQDSNWPVFFC